MECTSINFSSWISELLSDSELTDLCINGVESVYIDRGHGLIRILNKPPFLENEVLDWVLTTLGQIGKSWNAKHPFIDASLPSGHRLHVTFPPLSRQGLLLSLRRLPQAFQSSQLPRQKVLAERWNDSGFYNFLKSKIFLGDSILISGATGSGKTTLANDLLSEAPENERIIALEDTPELCPQHPHFLSMTSRPPNADGFGEVTLSTLLKQCLRMRPDRIILGECRGVEVLDLLQALNTGHCGALSTLHANSPRDALRRLELLCLLAGQGTLPIHVIRELLSIGIQWIVQVKQINHHRRISEVWKIEGREGETILLRQILEGSLKSTNG